MLRPQPFVHGDISVVHPHIKGICFKVTYDRVVHYFHSPMRSEIVDRGAIPFKVEVGASFCPNGFAIFIAEIFLNEWLWGVAPRVL